jgi:hypothetical protein
MGKRGTIEPVFYFRAYADPEHEPGYLMLSPYSDCPAPRGYTREYADTLADVDKFMRVINAQEKRKREAEFIHDELLREAATKSTRDRLREQMISRATTPYARDYLAAWFKLKDEQKSERYAQEFDHHELFLHAREFDIHPKRRVDAEK